MRLAVQLELLNFTTDQLETIQTTDILGLLKTTQLHQL